MGKISKYSNLYDKDGDLILKAGTTVKQIRELVEQAKRSKIETTKEEVINALKEVNITESTDSSKEVKDEGITHEPGVQGGDAKTIWRSTRSA